MENSAADLELVKLIVVFRSGGWGEWKGNQEGGLSGGGELEAQQQQRGMRERAAGELTARHQSSVTRTETTGGTAF